VSGRPAPFAVTPISSARLLGIRLNGMEVSEGIYNAALAGQFGVPIALVSGDPPRRRATTEGRAGCRGRRREGAVRLPLRDERDAGSRSGHDPRRPPRARLESSASLSPYRVTAPIALDVGFKLTIDAERAAFVPGLTRSDAHNVKGSFKDMVEITKLLQVLTSLEAP
jgi:D-amino peptidase